MQRARVDTEVRALADQVGEGMAPSWAQAVRAASVSRLPDLGDRLDTAVASTDLGAEKIPAWAGLVRVLQYVLIISAVVGAGWLALLAFGSYARLPEPPTPEVGSFPLPTLLLLGGIGLGSPARARVPLAGVADRPVAGAQGRQAAARRDLRGVAGDGRRADPGGAGVLRRGPRRARRRPALRSRAANRPQDRGIAVCPQAGAPVGPRRRSSRRALGHRGGPTAASTRRRPDVRHPDHPRRLDRRRGHPPRGRGGSPRRVLPDGLHPHPLPRRRVGQGHHVLAHREGVEPAGAPRRRLAAQRRPRGRPRPARRRRVGARRQAADLVGGGRHLGGPRPRPRHRRPSPSRRSCRSQLREEAVEPQAA